MPDLWMPGAIVRPARLTGGAFPRDKAYGDNAYGTLHTFEANPNKLSAVNGAKYLDSVNYSTHMVLNPVTGDIVQTIPANRAGRGLREDGNPRTNQAGRVHFQVEVIAYANTPFTSYWTNAGRDAFHAMLRYWNSWGVPMTFPNGALAATAAQANAAGHRIAPSASGLYGHSDWLDNDHYDPGALDQRLALPGGVPVTAPDPVTRVKMWQEIVEVTVDGEWGALTDARSQIMAKAAAGATPTGSDVKIVQEVVDTVVDGVWGANSKRALTFWTRSAQRWLGVSADGVWGSATQAAYDKARSVYHVSSTAPTKTLAPFALPSGEWYGVNDGTNRSHSGVRPADRAAVVRIQQAVGVSADGIFGAATQAAVKKAQTRLGVTADGKVGPYTWAKLIGG